MGQGITRTGREHVREYVREASRKTGNDLKTVARSVSSLTLPEIEAISKLVGDLIPAGNVPGVVLNAAARVGGRPTADHIRRDVNMLFKGVERVLDKAAYWAFFGGPAAVIWGYQNILKLAGQDPIESFPDGVWQFYADYALREDTARHTTETRGFDWLLESHGVQLSSVDHMTAWIMTAIYCLHQYPALLRNEWREHTFTYLLEQLTGADEDAHRYGTIYKQWLKRRPYSRSDEAAHLSYPEYGHIAFDRFLDEMTRGLPTATIREWRNRCKEAESAHLADYVEQMSILAYLEPKDYGEEHRPIPLKETAVGVISGGRYYLIPACAPHTNRQPPNVDRVRAQVAAMLGAPERAGERSANLAPLARMRRAALGAAWKSLSEPLRRDLERLRHAPILLNFDTMMLDRKRPLADLRLSERGVGDHALTLFDAGHTFIFDMSHIFYDGAWGLTLAEILTNEALSWAVYLNTLPRPHPASQPPPALEARPSPEDLKRVQAAPQATPEVGVYSKAVELGPIVQLRKLFKRRSDLLTLTVNDLLVLYRAIHAATYAPPPDLVARVESAGDTAAGAALAAIRDRSNPPILIPVDASPRSPRDRLYPMTFEVPLERLGFLELYAQTLAAYEAYQAGNESDRQALYDAFDALQRRFLATLAGFGKVMSRAKELALSGESANLGSIKMMAGLPKPLQRLMQDLPDRFDLLNDVMRGREVISNVGKVARTSTLTRFMTAKDDNEKKTLAWGIMTDAHDTLFISLRDFRPHVGLLIASGRRDLARAIAQDVVDSYARGLNAFVRQLHKITLASRETRKPLTEEKHV